MTLGSLERLAHPHLHSNRRAPQNTLVGVRVPPCFFLGCPRSRAAPFSLLPLPEPPPHSPQAPCSCSHQWLSTAGSLASGETGLTPLNPSTRSPLGPSFISHDIWSLFHPLEMQPPLLQREGTLKGHLLCSSPSSSHVCCPLSLSCTPETAGCSLFLSWPTAALVSLSSFLHASSRSQEVVGRPNGRGREEGNSGSRQGRSGGVWRSLDLSLSSHPRCLR